MGNTARWAARTVALMSIAATATFGIATAAGAQEVVRTSAAPAMQAGGDVNAAQSGTRYCGNNYDQCVQIRAEFRHLGHQVSEIYEKRGQTCPGGGGCADGYYFDWWI